MEMLVFVTIVFGGLIGWFLRSRPGPVRYRAKPVLAGSDRDLFFRLREALPECHICPQVGVAALIEPTGVGKMRKAAVDLMNARRVGHAVFDDEMRLLAVVRLVYRRGSRGDAELDAALASAGIRTVRFDPKRLPSEAKIRSSIFHRSRQGRQSEAKTEERGRVLEFRKTPWRDTIVHI
ncbi:MAG TPA: DUF2726 domain-containing protein [Noviherbaspirillum sp.]|uniref:DUF2726 domain-containing protein n=1 Tax=Noviherbaspirillum sp. TaxID=1926288 RepID=UPI002D4FCC03|nr:DUF2726 domain-containing protein [Noviherbaspirillum sp.]HYD94257.1 DUF2726 domain-containing protein [Noviherbaspirillum sp.]